MTSPVEASVDRVADAYRSGARTWILSDIHGNQDALDATLSLMQPGEPCIFLGDLLTYGCRPNEVLERIANELDARPSLLIWGNHDQMYRALAAGSTDYYDGIPPWIQESVDWTRERIGVDWLQWPWLESTTFDHILFDHANPYHHGDWSYVNSYEDHKVALRKLQAGDYRLGVVGHTHRAKAMLLRKNGRSRWVESALTEELLVEHGDTALVNTGSVGQPRNQERISTLLSLQKLTEGVAAKHHAISYDSAGQLKEIDQAGLSKGTQKRLASFFSHPR